MGFPLFCFCELSFEKGVLSMDDLEIRVKRLIEPIIKDMGIELEDIELTRMAGKALLRIFIDKKGGVTIDDCEKVSREIEAQLDVEDPMPSSYILEVSSPGLDRLLKRPEDFKRFCGKAVRVITSAPIENQTFFVGEMIEAGDAEILLLLPKDKKVTIPYKNISRARLEVRV